MQTELLRPISKSPSHEEMMFLAGDIYPQICEFNAIDHILCFASIGYLAGDLNGDNKLELHEIKEYRNSMQIMAGSDKRFLSGFDLIIENFSTTAGDKYYITLSDWYTRSFFLLSEILMTGLASHETIEMVGSVILDLLNQTSLERANIIDFIEFHSRVQTKKQYKYRVFPGELGFELHSIETPDDR
jgi:hypothetical protein